MNQRARLHTPNDPFLMQRSDQILNHEITSMPRDNIHSIWERLRLPRRTRHKSREDNASQSHGIVGQIGQGGEVAGLRCRGLVLGGGGYEVGAGLFVGKLGAVAA